MSEDCCNLSGLKTDVSFLDQTQAVEDRYAAAAKSQEACLCSPIAFNPKLLEVIPSEVIERDYGCGDPTRWIKPGDNALDLGSGSGKNAFICSQLVGSQGTVIGIDRNTEMLKLARTFAPIVSEKIGYSNVRFLEGSIESLETLQNDGKPLIEDSCIDIVLSNCVLNLVNFSQRERLLKNIERVLKEEGRVAISDIISSKKVPLELQKNPDLWSGCISGAWEESEFLEAFRSLGFKQVKYSERSEEPWKVIDDIEFRAVTLTAHL